MYYGLYLVLKNGLIASAPGKDRTCDTRIRNPVLYPLSYGGMRLN